MRLFIIDVPMLALIIHIRKHTYNLWHSKKNIQRLQMWKRKVEMFFLQIAEQNLIGKTQMKPQVSALSYWKTSTPL